MSTYVSRFYQVQKPSQFDYSTVEKKYFQVAPQSGNTQGNLNAGTPITFAYDGEKKMFRLADPESGFFLKIAYRTKQGAARAATAPLTLANGWFGHLFSTARFRLGSQDLETISELGPVMEVMQHLKGDQFRRLTGEDMTFIPDTGSGLANTSLVSNAEVTRTADQITARTTVPANVSSNNEDYNSGFRRRMNKYNYPLTGATPNDGFRFVTAFIPLTAIFGCCEEDKLLKTIGFEINLTRKPTSEFHEVFFGAANTGVEFGDPGTTGVMSMTLQLVEYIPNPSLGPEVLKGLEKPFTWSFMQRNCISRTSNDTSSNFSQTYPGVPRFVFVVAKSMDADTLQHGAVTRNYSLNRHCNMNSIQVDVDGVKYPSDPQNGNFLENNCSAFYQQFRTACKELEGYYTECSISPTEYKNLYTIFAVDCSNKPVKTKGSSSALTYNLTRNPLADDDVNAINPRSVKYFIISLIEKEYIIDCSQKSVRS